MKYNKEGEFDVYELFSNEKYRARLVLGFYAILIAILIITLRTGSTSNTKNDNSIIWNNNVLIITPFIRTYNNFR